VHSPAPSHAAALAFFAAQIVPLQKKPLAHSALSEHVVGQVAIDPEHR
jgi:hypothetical protein